MSQTLLLNSTYQFISFISERKVAIFLAKDKVEVISNWENRYLTKDKLLPAIVKMRYMARTFPRVAKFNRKGVLRRDNYVCQYCARACTTSQMSVDHIIPRYQGGTNNWKNCVAACKPCNLFKANRTPEQAGMTLLNHPRVPKYTAQSELGYLKEKHPEWNSYIF